MKKKSFIILTSVLMLSLTLVGVVYAAGGPTLMLDGPMDPQEGDEEELICSFEKTHPVLKRLAEQYDVIYEDLVDYFCQDDDIGVGEIKHALETAEILGDEEITYKTLLDMFIGGMDWGEIWKFYGLIGVGKSGPGEGGYGDDMDEHQVCSTDMDHPVLLYLAETYGVDYSELLTYFCEGFGVGEIKLALQTAEKTEDEDLWSDFLDMRKGEEEKGWGEIWQELGLIGKDKEKKEHPEGNPGNHGKPEDHPGKGKGLDKKP